MTGLVDTKVTLADFGPDSVWFASVGIPIGTVVQLKTIIDDETGETYEVDPQDAQGLLPFDWDLEGTVEAGEWCWDGRGKARDWNRNTVTAITAFRKEGS